MALKTKTKAKAAGAKKTTAKKASTKAAEKPKVPEKILENGSFVKFTGYRNEVGADEAVFEPDEILWIVGHSQDEENGLLYEAIKASEIAEYEEDPEGPTGGEVAPGEIAELKGGALDKAREKFVPVAVMGKLEEMLSENDNAVEVAILLNQEIQETSFWLGGALAIVLQEGTYLKANGGDFEGDDAWNEFCQAEFDFKGSKGHQLARIYRTFSQIEGFDPSRIDTVGWSKAAIAERFVTPENVDEVLELAESTTQRELAHTLKEKYVTDGVSASGRQASRGDQIVKKTLSFRLDEDSAEGVQLAIQACMKQNGIENEALALEHICVQWASEHVEAPSAQKRINSKINKAQKARAAASAPAEAPAKKTTTRRKAA